MSAEKYIYVSNCKKWVWESYFISLEIEGLRRIIRFSRSLENLGGEREPGCPRQPLSPRRKASQMRNQIPSK